MIVAVEFSRPLLSHLGKPIESESRPLTIGDALLPALLGTWQGDQRTPQRKARDVRIGLQISSGKAVELADDDRKHLKDVAFSTVPAAYLFVQICEALGFSIDEL